jgi:hypothetical protein
MAIRLKKKCRSRVEEMKLKARLSTTSRLHQQRQAIEQWLKKRTADHFCVRITTPQVLSEPVQKLLLGALHPEEQPSWMIDVPPQGIYHPQRTGNWFQEIWQIWDLTPGRLVVLTGQRLLVISTTGIDKNSHIASIPFENIFYLEHGKILLFSWLGIYWIENGVLREEIIYYNSVSEGHFLPLIQMLRRSVSLCQRNSLPQDLDLPEDLNGRLNKTGKEDGGNQNALRELPIKFANMLPHYGLLDDEHICQVLFRPANVRKGWGRTRMFTTSQMVLVRTDAYLLLAAEDTSLPNDSYGLTLTFLPLPFVRTVQTSRDNKQCFLHVHLEAQKAAEHWSFPFSLAMEESVDDFARGFRQILPAG